MTDNNCDFISMFRIERETMLNQIKNAIKENDAIDYLSKYRQLELEVEGYKKSLEILSDTTYQDRKHFLLELIQNADDASFALDNANLEFTIYSDRLELQYNEKGFELNDILAITDTGNSTKSGIKRKSNSFIGEKGIGFKSVFALAKSVEIHSSNWHFKLNKEQCIIPEKIENQNYQVGTKIVIHFIENIKNGSSIDIIANELFKYFTTDIETFLFLQQLSVFNLIDARDSNALKPYLLKITPSDRISNKLQIESSYNGRIDEYTLYSEKITFPKEVVSARWEKLGNEIGELERTFTIAIKLNSIEEDNGRVFCFLPTNVFLPIPIYLQIDGHTKADRESLHDPNNNVWNKFLLSKLPEFLYKSILEFRKEKGISDELYKYVPTCKQLGEHQFSEVLKEWANLMKWASWIKTYDEDWVSPPNAIIPNKLIGKLIYKFPGYRVLIEELLNKKFVHKSWIYNKNALEKLKNEYSVLIVDEMIESEILLKIGIPEEVLNNQDELRELYDHIIQYESLSGRYSWNKQETYKKIKKNILGAYIFPIEGENFSFLKKNEAEKNIFWIATQSKRETGIGSSKGDKSYFRIIDPQYTYIAIKSGSSNSQEYNEKIDKINDLNRSLKLLLSKLSIEELDEDTLLEKIQIPFLLKTEDDIIDIKYNVLFAMFKLYRLKKSPDVKYLKELSKIEMATFLNTDQKLLPLNQMLLPNDFINSDSDTLFENMNLYRLYLSDFIVNELSKEESKLQFKQFLIYCGIRYYPKFCLIKNSYDSIYDFSIKEKSLFNEFCRLVGNEYTSGRKLEISTYVFDNIMKELINTHNPNKLVLAKLLYEAWNMSFTDIDDLNSCNTSRNAKLVPGCVKIDYFRREPKSLLIDLPNNFFGEELNKIPLIAIDKRLTTPEKALRIRIQDEKLIKITSGLFPLVNEDKLSHGMHYESKYLDALKVPELTLSSFNKLWNDEQDGLIIIGLIELINLGYLNDGVLLRDKDSTILKPITEFRLGKGNYPNIPMIEEQYGESGRILGNCFSLKEEYGISNYQGAFERYFSSIIKIDSEVMDKIFNVFKNWKSWNIECKKVIVDEFKDAVNNYCNEEVPIFIFNNNMLSKDLSNRKFRILQIEGDPLDTYDFEYAAKEIGFVLGNDYGELISEGAIQLNDKEKEAVLKLTEGYLNTLQTREISRMLSNLSIFGYYKNWNSKIVKVTEVKRILKNKHGEVTLPVELPIIDELKSILYVLDSCKPTKMVAHLLSESGGILYKNVIRDLEDIEKSLKEIDKMKDIKINKEMFKNTISSDANCNNEQTIPINNAWRLGIAPETYAEYIDNAAANIKKTVEDGIDVDEKRHNEKNRELTNRKVLENLGYKIHLKNDFDGKMFLKEQYRGGCQVCSEKITLLNGDVYFECFHINKSRGETPNINMPFNILSLCPNCCIKAKQTTGREFKNIMEYAIMHKNGEIFVEENETMMGDFYKIPIIINGKKESLTISAEHLSYFSALFSEEAVNNL